MTLPRKLAAALLHAVARHAPESSRAWADAVLRELDFIESDREALFWAIGSTAAVFRHSLRGICAQFNHYLQRKEAQIMKNPGKIIGGLAAGIGIALAFALCVTALHLLSVYFFPGLEHQRIPWMTWLTIFLMPEAVFIAGIVFLWQRKRKPMAIGVLLCAMALATHFVMHVMHVVSHLRG